MKKRRIKPRRTRRARSFLKNKLRALRVLRGLILLLFILFIFTEAYARVGGGHSYSGGSRSRGGGGGDGGGGGGLVWLLIRLLIDLVIYYPAIGIPLLIITIVVAFYLFSSQRNQAQPYSSRAGGELSLDSTQPQGVV